MKVVSLKGKKIGRLIVVDSLPTRNGMKYWKCQCECGNIIERPTERLTDKRKHLSSCGCLAKENATILSTSNAKFFHPLKAKLRHVYSAMKERCGNPNNKSYKHYGARGISVCHEWINDSTAFYNWAFSNGYKLGLSIDRIDNNKGYSPSNCRWATKAEQSSNTSQNIFIEFAGFIASKNHWARILDIPHSTFHRYMSYGWSIGKLLNIKERQVA